MAETALRSNLCIDTDLPRRATHVASAGFLARASKVLAARLHTPTSEGRKATGTSTPDVVRPTWGNSIRKVPFQDMDMLENGHAREYLADQCLSPTQATSWTYSTVIRTEKDQFQMYWNTDTFLLSAKRVGGTFYISQYEDFPQSTTTAADPTGHYCAVLRKSSDDNFKLYSCGCEGCDRSFRTYTCSNTHEDATAAADEGADRQLLADISHYTKAASAAAGSAMRGLSIVIPAILDDKRSRVVWCPRVSRGVTPRGGTPRGTVSPRVAPLPSPHGSAPRSFPFDAVTSDRIKIASKLPVWCPEVHSLMLKFHGGRIREASAKNFMLMLDERAAPSARNEEDPNRVIMQFGKFAKSKFALDFRFPLAPIQAFAIGLSSCAWNVKAAAT